MDSLFENFYSTVRAAAPYLSDGGGPFGFDIHKALQIDHLIRTCGVTHFIETGSCLGDTTDFLSLTYPNVRFVTCDVNPKFTSFVQSRLQERDNVEVILGSSPDVIGSVTSTLSAHAVPLYYLDAHWGEYWPLKDELQSIDSGLIAIDDFDIGHPRFGFDTYNGVACNLEFVSSVRTDLQALYAGNYAATYPHPCLQVGRRAVAAYTAVGSLSCSVYDESSLFYRLDEGARA